MTLADQRKYDLLLQLLEAVEQDLYRQQLQAEALQAELVLDLPDSEKERIQAELDAVNFTITRLEARRQVWQDRLDKLPVPTAATE